MRTGTTRHQPGQKTRNQQGQKETRTIYSLGQVGTGESSRGQGRHAETHVKDIKERTLEVKLRTLTTREQISK